MDRETWQAIVHGVAKSRTDSVANTSTFFQSSMQRVQPVQVSSCLLFLRAARVRLGLMKEGGRKLEEVLEEGTTFMKPRQVIFLSVSFF